jgi:UV DNA damage endonuclease
VGVAGGNIRVGYPCINRSVGCSPNHTFRLGSYSKERFERTVAENLECLSKILKFNLDNGILFFRISSDIVPFASHPICVSPWRSGFSRQFGEIGRFIRKNSMRVSMHPDQFVLINALDEGIAGRSELELEYHCDVLDAMGLDRKAKVQIHVGGVYGNKRAAMRRFTDRYSKLSSRVVKRLVIENDDRLYSLKDCIEISGKTGVPVVFDVFHHECLSSGESAGEAFSKAAGTWKKADGPFMVDYSEQDSNRKKGAHAETIDLKKFKKFLAMARKTGISADIMLEIKDKEKSVLKVLKKL